MAESYERLLGSSGELAFALATLVLFLLLRWNFTSAGKAARAVPNGFTLPEWVLIAGLLAYPVYAFIGSLVLGVFVFRYAIPVVLGFDLALVGFLAWGSYSSRTAAACMLPLVALFAVAKQSAPLRRAVHRFQPSLAEQYKAQPWMAYACKSGLPVLTGAQTFLVWQHYAPSCLRSHLYYSTDPQDAPLTTGEQNITLFSRMTPLQVVKFQEFVRQHPRFIVVNTPWFARYIEASKNNLSLKVLSQANYESSYNDENGTYPVELNLKTVERH